MGITQHSLSFHQPQPDSKISSPSPPETTCGFVTPHPSPFTHRCYLFSINLIFFVFIFFFPSRAIISISLSRSGSHGPVSIWINYLLLLQFPKLIHLPHSCYIIFPGIAGSSQPHNYRGGFFTQGNTDIPGKLCNFFANSVVLQDSTAAQIQTLCVQIPQIF